MTYLFKQNTPLKRGHLLGEPFLFYFVVLCDKVFSVSFIYLSLTLYEHKKLCLQQAHIYSYVPLHLNYTTFSRKKSIFCVKKLNQNTLLYNLNKSNMQFIVQLYSFLFSFVQFRSVKRIICAYLCKYMIVYEHFQIDVTTNVSGIQGIYLILTLSISI